MSEISDLGELGLHDIIRQVLGGDLTDDCAILGHKDGYLLLSIDRVWERTHMPPGSSVSDFGYYAIAAAVSDIAAMAAIPEGCLVALGLPQHMDEDEFTSLMKGIEEASRSLECPVIGGDTKEDDSISIAVAVIGTSGVVMRRTGIEKGMKIYLSRWTGHSGISLDLIMDGHRDPWLYRNVLRPRIEIDMARDVASIIEGGARAGGMDISDGLVRSLRLLGELNGCGFRIYSDTIVRGVKEVMEDFRRHGHIIDGDVVEYHLLQSGGDFALLVASDTSPGEGWIEIGEVIPSMGIFVDDTRVEDMGYEHLRKRGMDTSG